MKNLIHFESFDQIGAHNINEETSNISLKKLDSMSDTQLYDYFYKLVKENPDSYIKYLKSMGFNPVTASKLYQVDSNMLIQFLESVKKGKPLGSDSPKEKEYMGKRFKAALYILSGLILMGAGTEGEVLVNGKKLTP